MPSRYQQFMTSEDEDHSRSSSAHSSEDEEEEEEEQEETAGKSVTSTTTHTQSISPAPLLSEAPLIPAPANDTSQVFILLLPHHLRLSARCHQISSR